MISMSCALSFLTCIDALEYDCVCKCCLPDQCDSNTYTYEYFNVGDPELCTENMCASEVYACPDSGSHNDGGKNIATYMDCSCECCKDSTCPTKNKYAFHSGSRQKCNKFACSSQFYSCPDPGTHSQNSENYATFYDCTCGCADSPSDKKEFNRFDAGVSTKCTRGECESRFTKCKDEGASVIEAWYTGEESESDMFDSSPWETYNDGKVRISIGGKTVTLSKGEAAGVAVVVLLFIFSVIGYFGYRVHQRRRGYRWMVFDHDEEGRMVGRETKGSGDVEMSSNNNTSGNGNAENVVQMSSLRAQHATTITTPDSAPVAPSNDSNTPSNDDTQMSPYRVD